MPVWTPFFATPGGSISSSLGSPDRRCILAGSRPGGRGTLVSAKAPKAICACAIARQIQRVPCTPCRLSGSGQGPFFAPAFAASLERPVRPGPGRTPCCASLSLLLLASPGLAVRGEPVQRGKGPLGLCLDPLRPFRARSGPTSLSSLHCPAPLESPGFAVRGEPARRGDDSLDPRLLSDSPLGAGLGERRPKNTNSKHRSSAALLTRLE